MLYAKGVPDTTIKSIKRYGPNEDGKEGDLNIAVLIIAGVHVFVQDRVAEYTILPRMSLSIEFDDEGKIVKAEECLSSECRATVLSPLKQHESGVMHAELIDEFGVRWEFTYIPGY